jgi:hypothetical protein
MSIFKRSSKEGREEERQAKVVADTDKLFAENVVKSMTNVAKNMTQDLPEDIRTDQENKLIDLFNKENKINKELSENSDAMDIIRGANKVFKDGYESTKKSAIRSSKLEDMTKSDIDFVVDKLNEIIKIYDNVLNDFSDKKEMEKILRENKTN